MKIVTYNINGIRAAMKKGLVEWIGESNPDVICFQEVKAEESQIDKNVFLDLGYEIFWHSAEKKGYSGVAIFSKVATQKEVKGIGIEKYDREGRLLELHFKEFVLVNSYFPSGTSGEERQQFKYDYLDDFFDYITELKKKSTNIILCGDFNICHKPIDIHNPTRNKNTSGFLPEERAWIGKLLEFGFTDSFRHFSQEPHHYTWWSYRAGARKKNLGWRIDYFMNTHSLDNKLNSCKILSDVVHSDHCPIEIEIN